MVFCRWCEKYATCDRRRDGITVCGDFAPAEGRPTYHIEVEKEYARP